MKLIAFLFNVAAFGFTCLVLATDGISKEAAYIVLTLLLLLVPVFNLVVIAYSKSNAGWLGLTMKRKVPEEPEKRDDTSSVSPAVKTAAILCNVILLGLSCWAFVDQHPHPRENGFILYIIVVGLTPIISSVTILLSRIRRG